MAIVTIIGTIATGLVLSSAHYDWGDNCLKTVVSMKKVGVDLLFHNCVARFNRDRTTRSNGSS